VQTGRALGWGRCAARGTTLLAATNNAEHRISHAHNLRSPPQGKKPDKVNPAEELLARWTRCHISGEPLAEPCVVDELGSLFNKEALVHALLNRTLPAALAHISGLKQLPTLRLEPLPRAGGGKAGAASAAAWQCPITGLEMNGRARFVVHRPTGRALAERALKEAPAAVEELLGGPWAADDLIVVNPLGDELFEIRERLAARMSAERQKKLAKKMAKKGADAASAAAALAAGPAAAAGAAGAEAGAVEGADGAARSGSPSGSGGSGSGGNNAAGAATAAGGKRPAPAAAPVAVTASAAGAEKAAKKIKVPSNATPEVYKSIFHTADEAAARKETYSCRAVSGRWRC
jgi:hypothetical protein